MKCNRTRSYEVHKFRLKLLLLQLRCPSFYFNKCSTAFICNGYKSVAGALACQQNPVSEHSQVCTRSLCW